MVTFVIFWAALFCIIFFLLETFFKTLASFFSGFIYSAAYIIAIAILTGLGVIALLLIYFIANAISTDSLGETIGILIAWGVFIGIIVGLIGGLGSALIGLIVRIVEVIICVVSTVFEGGANICEKAYVHFLLAIVKRLDKC